MCEFSSSLMKCPEGKAAGKTLKSYLTFSPGGDQGVRFVMQGKSLEAMLLLPPYTK